MRLVSNLAATGFLLGSAILLRATPAIGVALTHGSVRLNHVLQTVNTPVFEGTLMETEMTAAQLQFPDGGTLQVAPGSRATLYTDRVVLEQGALEVRNRMYEVVSNTLRVTGSSARVTLHDSVVQVAALSAAVRVANGKGVLVAALEAGQVVDLTPDKDAQTSALHGCLSRSGNAYLLRDHASKITAELRGSPELAQDVGKRVAVSGTLLAAATPVKSASQVLQVAAIEVERRTCSSGAGALVGLGGLGGLGTTTVVAGVVVAAVVVATPLALLASQSSGTATDLSPVK